MAILAHSKHDEVKRAFSELLIEEFFIFVGAVEGIFFALHAEDLVGWNAEISQSRVDRHFVIAIGMIDPDTTLIAPEKNHFFPVDCIPIVGVKFSVNQFW